MLNLCVLAMLLNGLDPLLRLQQVVASLTLISAEAGGVQDLLQRVVRETMRFTGATGAVVEQLDDDELVAMCAAGSLAAYVGRRLPRRGSLSGLATFSEQIQQCDDSATDARANREASRENGMRSILVAPLLFGRSVIGVLKATSERVAAFGPLDRDALQYSAGIIAAALGREMRQEADRRVCTRLGRELDVSRDAEQKSRREARIDLLTGMPNRRQFERWLAIALKGHRSRMALLFLDLDGFKAVNDTHGHAIGDAALCRVAEILQATLPKGFRAARLGGDEFVVLATDLDEDDEVLIATARAVLTKVERPQLLAPGVTLKLAVSIGGAVRDSDALARGEWMKRADNAMYAAKASGHNQFRLYATRKIASCSVAAIENSHPRRAR